MSHYDVFNGDADGLCALQQLRLADPNDDAQLVTGVKRDIALLQQVEAKSGDSVTVLDISLDKNRGALVHVLEEGAEVEYFDHHFAGDIPQHEKLTTHINTAADVCTSLLVSAHLQHVHLAWAVTGAFGDNLHDVARAVAVSLNLGDKQLDILCELGTCLNYNGYGTDINDLYFHPRELAKVMRPYVDPFDFASNEAAYRTLRDGYNDDMAKAAALQAEFTHEKQALYVMPDAPWSRRVSGVYGNQLARDYPDRAHAILTALDEGAYRVSIRAPLSNKTGADELCREFPTGGGRAAAAGINRLEANDYDCFVERFFQRFS